MRSGTASTIRSRAGWSTIRWSCWPTSGLHRGGRAGGGARPRQSGRELPRLGCGDRRAAVAGHRLAGQPHQRGDRGAARRGAEAVTLERAGLPLDPYFSAAKLAWILAAAGAGARGAAAAARHDGCLVSRPADRHLRHRRHHRLAHLADEPRDLQLGRRAVPAVRGADRVPARDPADRRAASAASVRVPVTAAVGRPAGGALRPWLPARRAMPRSPSAPAPSRWR